MPPSSPSPSTPSPPAPPHTNYRIGRGETGVLTHEPYKSALLPLWRFRTPALALASAQSLWARFLEYDRQEDFVGMDMCRKFIQMGMTRAKRYANYPAGRKFAGVEEVGEEGASEDGDGAGDAQGRGEDGVEGGKRKGGGGDANTRTERRAERAKKRGRLLAKSDDHPGKREKEEASLVFRRYWVQCREHEGYIRRKKQFQKEQRAWEAERKRRMKS